MNRNSLGWAGVFAAAFVAASFLGNAHRSADTLALLRPLLGIMCLLSVFWSNRRTLKVIGAIGALAAALSTAGFFLPQPPGGGIRIYSKNLSTGNSQISEVAADIEAAGVDAVFLQEVSDQNRSILEELRSTFPHQHVCRFSSWLGIAIASRHPFVAHPKCTGPRALAAAPITLKGTRVWLVSVHLPWPWPIDSTNAETAANKLLSELKGPVIVAGDFNSLPWLSRVGNIRSAFHGRIAGPVRPTFQLLGLPLPIDLAMSPGGGTVELRSRLGSDHAGIVADLALSPR